MSSQGGLHLIKNFWMMQCASQAVTHHVLSESKLLSSTDENLWKPIALKEIFQFLPAKDVALNLAEAWFASSVRKVWLIMNFDIIKCKALLVIIFIKV